MNQKKRENVKKKNLLMPITITALISCVILFVIVFFTNSQMNIIQTIKNSFGKSNLEDPLNTKYHVSFYDGNGSMIWDTYVEEGWTLITEGEPSEQEKTFIYEGDVPKRNNRTFDGWVSSTGSFTITQDTEFTAYFLEDTRYVMTFRYISTNGVIVSEPFVTILTLDATYSYESPQVEGYTPDIPVFEGTLTEQKFYELQKMSNVTMSWENNHTSCTIIITITYEPADSSYKIVHLWQNTQGTDYEVHQTEEVNENVKVGDIVTSAGKEKVYTGFKKNDELTTTAETVKADGTTEIKIYYDRETYYIYYDSTGGTFYNPQPTLYGAPITLVANPSREGYRFVNWTWSKTHNGEAIDQPETMPDYDLYANANWRSVETNYSISYYVENADDDDYSILGEATSKTLSEDKLDLDAEETNIKNGFREVIGSNEYSYYTYNKEMTASQNSESDLTINGDGSTIIKVYYKRNTYTLTFHLGTKSGSNYRIYTGSSTSSTTSTSQKVTLDMNESTYEIGGEEYKITAKYGQNIAELWPTVGLHIEPQSIRASSRTYYAYAWLYRKGGSSSYTSQVSGIYTMNKDLIYNNAGSDFYLQWSTSQPNYTVHYMFETLDNQGTLYSGSYNYYKNHYFKENEALQVKVSNTSMGYKTIDGYNYYESADSERKNYDIYLYYLRNEYTLTFYSVNTSLLPDLSSISLENGISKGDGVLIIKYGADISKLSKAILHPQDYTGTALGKGEWQFEQWYTDINATIPMVWEGATMKDSMMLYAKWIAPTYEVTYNTDGGKWLEDSDIYTNESEGIYRRVVDEGTVLTPPKEPTKLGYHFDGWYYVDTTTGDEIETRYLFSESQNVYDNIVLTARWLPRTDVEYTVRYVEAQFDDGVLVTDISKYSEIVDVEPPKVVKDNAFGSIVTEDAIIATSNEVGRFYISDARQKTIVLDKERDEDNVIYFFYAKVESASYTVYYLEDRGIRYKEGDVPPSEEWLADPTKGVATGLENAIVTVENQEIAGYVPNALSQTLMLIMDEKFNTIYFYYTENTQKGEYKLNFWFMNEQGGYSGEPDYTTSGELSVGSTIYVTDYGNYLSLSDKRYIGHVLDTEHSDTYSIVTSTDDVAILDIFFKNATYKITFHTQGGTWKQEGEEYKKIDNNTYQTEVTYPNILVRPTNPEKQNAELVGWHEVTTTGEEKSVSSTKFTYGQPVTRDLDLYLVWKDKKEITIQKIWVDDNDRDGRRPARIELNLLQNGATYKDIDITRNDKIEDNKWQIKSSEYKYNYDNTKIVFVYEENGVKKVSIDPINKNEDIVEILMIANSEELVNGANLDDVQKEVVYTIEEKAIGEYTTEYDQETLTITNTHEVALTEKTVMKVWEDDEDRDGIRPDNITVRLLANGEQYKEDIVLNEANDWQYVWENLYVYEEGEPIDYTLEEVTSVNGYETHIMQTRLRSISQSFIIRNMHEPDTIEKTVTKEWDDNENQDGKRPGKVVVNLLADGKILDDEQIELNEENGWTHTWTLYKNNAGEEITYSVEEVVPGDYTEKYEEDDKGNVTITNTHTPEKTNKTVTKLWEDKQDQDGIRPESVMVQLKADDENYTVGGENVGQVELNEANNWTYEWTNLDVYANGNPITYKVVEEDVPNDYNVSYDQETLTVTNTHEVEKVSKTVTKIWNDSNDQDGRRPESINVKLYANGVEVREATLSEANGWTYTWNDLDKNSEGTEIAYTAREEKAIGEYTTSYDDETLTITNSYEPKKINKTVTIQWEDKQDQDGIRPETIQVELYANDTLVGEPIILSAKDFSGNSWKYVWENLPQYSNKVEIQYKVKQKTNIDEYSTTYSENTFTITNTHTPKVADKTVTKVWRDADDKEGIRPGSVTLQLYANGKPVGDPVTLTEEDATEGKNNWTHTWEGLDVYANGEEIVYTVKEPKVPEQYGVLYNQKTLTVYNAFPPEVDVEVTKKWEDEENADGKRPESIMVQLKADDENYTVDGENVGQVELNAANNWTYKWEFIEKYNEETEEKYHYSVEEIAPITDYTVEYKAIADEEDEEYEYQFEIINTHPVEKITRTVKKEWDDNEDQDGKRPEQISVNLLANEQIVDTVTLSESNGWTYTWDAINKNKLGEEISYRIEEVDVDENEYTSSIEYDETTQTYTIKNHHDIEKITRTVKKEWDDNEDQDGKRPEKVTVQLKANNEAYGEPVVLTQEEGWTHTWEDLNKYQDGEEIEYTVEEVDVDENEYTGSVEYDETTQMYTIKNHHDIEKITKTVTKQWNDKDDQDGKRPENVTVQLKANNEAYGEPVVLTQEEGWTHVWENLNKYQDGEEIEYTVEEKEVAGYTTEYDQETLTITNTHEVALTERTVMKVWEDDEDRDGIRPDNITVRLLANGEQYKEDIVLNEANDWQYVWENLYVYEGGEPIDYTLEEVTSVNGYETHIMQTRLRSISQSFIIRNMHEPDTIEKTVTKKWDDNENQDGKRPGKVVVNLLADGEILDDEQIELNEENGWTHTWTLYKNNAGEEITYSIEEVVPGGYTEKYEEDDKGNVTITNTHTPEKTNKTVTKVWEDKEDQDGIRPEKVYLRLYANDQYKEEQILSAQNDWTYEWTNLDVYANGNPITYKVVEADVPNDYNVSYNQETLTVTNTHEVEKVSKTVTKIWNDSNDQDGRRPESINVKLYANGVEVREATLSEANGWTYTWNDLDKNSEGTEIAYTAREEKEIEEYTTSYDDETLTITNSYEPKKINKTVTIQWEDKSNQDGIRPETIQVELYANNTLVGEPITLSAEDFSGNSWKYVWEDLPQYSNKVEIQYEVKQKTNIDEYSTTYSEDTFTITNSHTPKVADKTVTKVWRDADDKEGIRPGSVTLQLYANGEPVGDPVTLTEEDATEGKNNWKHTWAGLDVYANGEEIVYTVKEPKVPEQYGVLYNQKTLTVYNAFPPEVDVEVTKKWEDEENADGKRPESIMVQLKADDENYTVDGENVGQVELNAANNWTYKWEFIEKYNAETEEKYHYSVEEIAPITDYTVKYNAIADEEDEEYEYQFEIINTHPVEKITRTVKKEWDDNEDQDGKRPEQISVNLLANEQIVDTVTLSESNGWTYTWDAINKNKLGEEISYRIEEVDVDENEYTSSIEYDEATQTYTIKNHHDIEKITKTVTKQWNDKEDQDGKRPENVTVQLKANNVAYGEPVVLTQEEGWTHTWEDLNKYQDGEEIEYTVEEKEVVGYTTEYKQDEDNNLIIENTHTPAKINKTVKKEWRDNDNQDGLRLHSVFVVLKANGVVCSDKVELTQEEGWTYTWKNLDEFANKNKVLYEVEEITEIEGYTTSYNEDKSGTIIITNSHTPYTVETSVTKQWADNDNQDGKRPESIQVQLKADGAAYGELVTLNDANGWSHTYEDLPERKAIETTTGKMIHYIEYTVEEIVPQEYQASYDKDSKGNTIITNTHIPEKEEKQVNIQWVDKNNANGTRPTDITIQLYANNEPYGDEVVLKTESDLTNIWKGLNKYSEGTEITYTVKQKEEITGYTTTYSEDENGVLIITNTLNQYDYTVKYYYDGKINADKTENLKAHYGDRITTYTNNELKNYHFVEDKNCPLVITTDKNQNIIEVYYERDENQVQIKYLDKYTNNPVSEEVTLKGKIGDPYDITSYEREVSDYTLVQWPEEKTGVFEEDPIEKTYYYAKNTKVTVKYLEKGTNQVLDTEEVIKGHQGKKYTTKKREIKGYTFIESTKNTEGEMPRKESEVIYYYAENTEVIVKYVDRANQEVITEENEYIIKGYEGKEYSAEQKKIEGYTFIEKTDNAEGKMTKEPQKVTMYYAKNSKVIVKYLEKSTNKVLKEETIEGYEGKAYKTEQKEIDNYTFIEATDNTQGNMGREDIEVKYYYAQNSSVKVQHIDREDNKVLEEVIINGKEGDVVRTSAIEIGGYVLKDSPKNENVTMTKQEIIVKYYYARISQGVVEKHIDDVTGEILYSKTYEGAKGDSYEIKAKEFAGYDLVEGKLPGNSKGTMKEEAIEVVYYYVKRAQVRVQYIDKLTDEPIEEVIIKGHEGDKYKTEQKEIENYVFIESTNNTEGKMQVTVNGDKTFNIETIVKYYYIKKSKGVVENHIDYTTRKVLETKEYTGKVGDPYITYPREFTEYDLVEEEMPQNAQGAMKEELIEVNYYYIQKSKVTVQYIDIQTKEILYEEEILGHEKDKYETEQRKFDNYDIVKEELPENKEGEMTKENIVVKYYYIRKAEVEVKYIEKETGIAISEKEIIAGHVEDTYESEPKEISYYKFIESTENAKGKMTKDKITVIHYYEKLVFDIQVSTEGIIKDGITMSSENDLYKIEIPANEVTETNMKITYLIRIKNVGQIEGYVEELKTRIPNGFIFNQEDNELNWEGDGGIITTTDLKEKQLNPEEYIDIQLVLRWVGTDNAIFGAEISEFTLSKLGNPALFEDVNLKSNTANTTILISIKTGEDNSLIIKVITSIISILTLVATISLTLIRNSKK